MTVDYGRGTSPILPQSIVCGIHDTELSECQTTNMDASDCQQVAGVNCGG